MTRFTSIGMAKKTFVQSSTEERSHSQVEPLNQLGSSSSSNNIPKPKRKVRSDSGGSGGFKGKFEKRSGWGRDPNIARKARRSEFKSQDRRQKRIAERNSSTTCFACRSVGHAARDCPNILIAASGANGSAAMLEAGKVVEDAAAESEILSELGGGGDKMKRAKGKKGGDVTGGKCYRCNSSLHSLSKCPKPIDLENPTPFAICFVCLGTGHLSASCPSNSRGVYVNGGSCKICGQVSHRAKDCPKLPENQGGVDGLDDEDVGRSKKERRGEVVVGSGGVGVGADEDDFMELHRQGSKTEGQRQKQRIGERQSLNKRHEPAKNSMRGPAKVFGIDEGAYERPIPSRPKPSVSITNDLPATSNGSISGANRFAPSSAAGRSKPKVVSF